MDVIYNNDNDDDRVKLSPIYVTAEHQSEVVYSDLLQRLMVVVLGILVEFATPYLTVQSLEHEEDVLLVLEVLYALGLVDVLLRYPLQREEVFFVDNEVDRAQLAAA